MAGVTISNAALAQQFVRLHAPRGTLAGWGMAPADKWLARANCYAERLGPQRVAESLTMLRAKPKAYQFHGVRCLKCNARLSNPESVAAMVGPECMAK